MVCATSTMFERCDIYSTGPCVLACRVEWIRVMGDLAQDIMRASTGYTVDELLKRTLDRELSDCDVLHLNGHLLHYQPPSPPKMLNSFVL